MKLKFHLILTACSLLLFQYAFSQVYVLDSVYTQVYDPFSNSWSLNERDIFFNNSDYLADSLIRSYWDGTKWVNARFYTYGYDLNKNLDYRFRRDWSFATQQWVNKYQYYNIYALTTRVSNIREDWQLATNNWQEAIYYTYQYDINGHLSERIRYIRDLNTNSWINNRRYIYVNDSNGYRIQNTRYNWNTISLSWTLHSRYEYTNDANGRLLTRVRSIWDSNTSSWLKDSKVDYLHDSDNNLIEEVKSVWQVSSNSWQLDRQKSYFRSQQQVLPVSFLSFEGKLINYAVQLQWKTTLEINNQGFEIQKSEDNRNWLAIGWEDPINSSSLKTYSFIDDKPRRGINYYRLKQIDTDGQFAFSNTIEVNVAEPAELFSIYPNPVSEQLNIRYGLESLPESLSIYSINGTLVREYNSLTPQLDFSTYKSGIYILKFVFKDGRTIIKRLYKLL